MRVLGDVTEGDALEVLRQVDEIFINTIREFGLYDDIWQAFAVFLPVRHAPWHGRCACDDLRPCKHKSLVHLCVQCFWLLKRKMRGAAVGVCGMWRSQ